MAQVLNGKEAAKQIQDELKTAIKDIRVEYPSFLPTLAIIQVGNREDSNVYIRMKIQAAEDVGMKAIHISLPKTTTEKELVEVITSTNNDTGIHGMIIQLPLESSKPINTERILNLMLPKKDLDGLHAFNVAKLARGEFEDCILPCTPVGCLDLIKRTGISIEGKRAVVVGRSKIVGAPMANLLTWNHATVTICHSRTVDLPSVVKQGEIVVVAIGKPELVKGSWLQEGAVVIDCGINSIPDLTRPSGKRLVGDVEYGSAKNVASWITPVPGGVGPMTVAMLLKNTLNAAKKALERASLDLTELTEG